MFKTNNQHKYGILLSGGLDSAVLLCLLVKQNTDIKLQPFTIDKVDGAMNYVNKIIDFVNSKFGTDLPHTIVVGDPTVHHRMQSATAVIDIFNKYPVDFLYNALNKNPEELESYPGAPKRTTKSIIPQIILPFVNMYKSQILELLYSNDLEELINITHSCTEQVRGRCNTCWQCTERIWAFNQLNMKDTGVL